ncbi:MAG: hypothetical protein Q8P59_05360 [Dehalococcoidia bacterium]|nr:hypothetical protein [Dehalococcoidia bacterium]
MLFWALPLVGFIIILIAFYDKVTPLSIGQRLNNQPAGEIQGNFAVGQTFYSPYPGLYRIDVLLATYARPNSGPVTFNLSSISKLGTRLATIPFEASQVADNRFRSFEFPSQGDAAGKNYLLYFEAPGARPGNAITVWTYSANPYSEGLAYLGGRSVENDLTFVAYFRPGPWQLAGVYLDQMARGKPGIWGSPVFYAATFLIYLALVGAFLALLFRRALR